MVSPTGQAALLWDGMAHGDGGDGGRSSVSMGKERKFFGKSAESHTP